MDETFGRRRFLGYVLAAPTLVTAAEIGLPGTARAELPSPDITEIVDLNDMMTLAALPTSGLIAVEVGEDGTVSFALPRAEVGQGITTSTAMLIAEELSVPVDRVRVTLADARPELLFNQLTGGSNTTIATYTPIRVAAAIARQRLLAAAEVALGSADLTLANGVITD
ncbi:MAG: molybdopterin-dependent oxidoreductase, partial [Actinomycetota bacterium]|nr:molybdopterin-dependent oxidoreductase [Actinomycetota bacterium]